MSKTKHLKNRILSVKLDLQQGSDLWKRLRDLAQQQTNYRNHFLRARLAEAMGLRVDPEQGDPHDVTKHVRRFEKGELSGAAYSAAERECQAVWTRDGKKILAGAPMSQWRWNNSLSVRGHKNRNESGIRLTLDGDRFMAHLQLQAHTCEGGSWLEVPLARGVHIDDWQAPILKSMVEWETPIAKATMIFKPMRGKTFLQLCYALEIPLPVMGERVATLGPSDGRRLFLRSETQSIDCSHKLTIMKRMKDEWDTIRRRWVAQIGKRKGAARAKRRKLVKIATGDWFKTFLHQWSREVVEWCQTQGIGRIVVLPVANLDWPAHQFVQYLEYKASDYGITVSDEQEASIVDASTKRALKQEVSRSRTQAKRKIDAVRTLRHNLKEMNIL